MTATTKKTHSSKLVASSTAGKKSLLALSKEIPDGKYKGLSKLLGPHEMTKQK